MDLVVGLERVGCGLLATVFLISGVAKIRAPYAAALAIVRFGLVATVNPWTGRAAGAIELTAAAALLILPNTPYPLFAACGLLAFFSVLLASALMRGDRFSCACFGPHGSPLSYATLGRTLGLTLVAIISLFLLTNGGSTSTWEAHILGMGTGVLVVCVVLLLNEVRRIRAFAERFQANA